MTPRCSGWSKVSEREPVGLDHRRDVGGLDGDLDVVEVDLLEVGELHAGRLDERLRGGAAVPLVEVGVQRAGVHADADRHAAVLRLAGDELDLLGLAQVARIEPEPLHAGLQRRERHLVRGSGRRRRSGPGERGTIWARPSAASLLVAGAAHDVGARAGEGVDLGEGALGVGGLGRRHRLDRDRGVAADRDLADHDLAGRLGVRLCITSSSTAGGVLGRSRRSSAEIWR